MSAVRIALLRGVNVGGHGKLPMVELRGILVALGATQVQTYIQSGNAVFTGDLNPVAISEAIHARFGFRPACQVLSRGELARAIGANPFPKAISQPKTLHLFFLSDTPHPDPEALDAAARSAAESWRIHGRCFYLHSPNGFGISKLAQGLERRLGVEATGRNWATVTRLLALADEMDTSR